MKKEIHFYCFIVIYFVFGILNGFAFAAEFTADLVVKNPVETYKYKIYVKDSKYRLVNTYSVRVDMPPVVIADRNNNSTWALYPPLKKYELLNESEAFFIDPIRMFEMIPIALKTEKKHEGVEVINGYECDKYVYILNSAQKVKNWQNKPVEIWVAKKLNHIIKGITHQDKDGMLELQNIKEEPVDNNLFEIPSNYEQFKD